MHALNPTHLLTLVATSVALGVSAPIAAAAAPSTAIAMTWQTPYVTSAPWAGSGSGIFTASGAIKDTGSLSVAFHLGGAPSPSVLNLHSDRTLSGALGTITLRCNEFATDFANPAVVPVTGDCTVITGTGAYVGLQGQGTMSGSGDTAGPAAILVEMLRLSTP